MLSVLLVAVLGAEPVKLASTGFVCEGATPTLCDAYLERFVGELARGGRVKVSTQSDIAQVIGIERQKQLLGCAEDGASCMAELANALGVDGVVTGTIAKTSIGFLLNVKVVRARDATRWASVSTSAKDEVELQQALDRAAADFKAQLGVSTTAAQVLPWLTLGAGLVAAAGGGVTYGFSKTDAALLKSNTAQMPSEIAATASQGALRQTLGITLLSLGLVVAVAGLVWLLSQ